MTEDDKAALIEFLRGGAVVGIVVGVIILGLAFLLRNGTELKPSAEVVDTYKECDIVRWTAPNLAEYKYFLYCEKNK